MVKKRGNVFVERERERQVKGKRLAGLSLAKGKIGIITAGQRDDDQRAEQSASPGKEKERTNQKKRKRPMTRSAVRRKGDG